MKQFNNTAILTSKNPEAFLNFTYDGTDYWIIPDGCIGPNVLYVNGLDLNYYLGDPSYGYALRLNYDDNVASFHIYTPQNFDFDLSLGFTFYDSSALGSSVAWYGINVKNRPFLIQSGAVNAYSNEDLLIDDEASYMLMRTNPKFTGNIVLYVDSSNYFYMDTFKVSDILSNKKYRHQLVSGNSVLSSDIRNIFSTLPLGELYRVDVQNTLEIAIPKTQFKDQYNTTYNYGAKLIKDELYPEDNGLLAPLWINSKLPDYFAVFRLGGVFNQETYDGSSLTNLAFKYLQESDLIRSWSLKPQAPLGKYLATHMADVVKIQAPVFLSLTDPSLVIAESDPNTWYGIAVDKGVLTGRSETTYFFNQKSQNFTDLNAFVSQGFERNTLLCPNLINLEYLFSDEDVSLYTMSRYFGFYLTENVLYKIAYYSDSSSGPIEILSMDGKDSSVFMNSPLVFDPVYGTVTDEYKNRLFVLNDEIQLKRITDVGQIDETNTSNPFISKPYKNIFNTAVEKNNINPFITLTLNNKLEQGEHLRIINKTQGKIWEVYSTDASAYPCERYCTISENPGYPTVYRTFFNMNGDISFQVKQIEEAFDRFADYEGTYFRSGMRGSNWVSLILNDDASFNESWEFQRISAPTLNDFEDPSSGFNTASIPGDITFFGRFTPDASDFGVVAKDSSYGPIDFELYGDRQSITVNFIKRENNTLYSFLSDKNILDKFEIPTLYQGTDLWYRRILDFDVSNNSYQYVKDPLHSADKVLIMTAEEIQLVGGKFNAYNIYPLNLSLMGINPVKDIDYTVYDQSLGYQSQYFYNRECDSSTYNIQLAWNEEAILDIPGSYVVQQGTGTMIQAGITSTYDASLLMNTFDSSIYFLAVTPTLITYAVLDGSYNYKSYKDGSAGNEEDIADYYDSSTLLKYGLTIPLVSKWVGLGNDCRNNPLRLILNTDVLDVSTNFIPDDNNFTQEISIPSFKYLSACGRAWEDYIFYDINDALQDGSEYYTFREMMFKYPYIDYFSKLMYSNYNVDATKTRSSIVYYNQYKNTIDVIFMGLNLSIRVENIAKNSFDIKNYDRYRFSFISSPSRNRFSKRPIEVIINENTQTILMIWYQGNDELNYNKRYSTFLPGKALLDPSDLGFVSGKDASNYSFVKTPFIVRNDTINKSLERYYGSEPYDSQMVQPYAQFNKNLNGLNSAWNAFGANTISGLTFNVDTYKDYETFPQYVEYDYAQNANTYGDYVLNYGYNYNNNKNWYVNNTCNLTTLKTLLSTSYTYVMYYVIRGDEVYNSLDFGSNINPLTIKINSPRTYMGMSTYNGWFKPSFNNILEFKSDENEDFVNVVDRDFTFSNTNLRLYNNIPQLWYNRVVTEVTQTDVSEGNAISFASNFNVFKALWDADYYTLSDGGVKTLVDGYESIDELSAFFGSKLPKFPNQILLQNWDITTASSSQTTTEITLSFNLTRSILTLFKSNPAFLANWSAFTNTDNVIDGYVKNTVLTYYNISQPKIIVDYYFKSYDSKLLYYTYDSNFIHDNKQNFNGQLVYQNDEYIYKIVIPKTGNFSYFITFTLTEK
jgi:hypothetical protein